MRIVSLVPSFTKTLFDFELDSSQIVGRTKFCIHPKEEVTKVQIIGGTKDLKLEKIRALKPDLILASKEENEKDQVESLQSEFNVWVTDIQTLIDNKEFLMQLGERLQKQDLAHCFNKKLDEMFNSLPKGPGKSLTYFIWKDPYLSVGGDTFIHAVIEQLGFKNSHEKSKRYPMITLEALAKEQILLLSSEPYPFKEKHKEELLALYPHLKIHLVDGEAFSWYGTHLLEFESHYRELVSIL